MIGPTAGIYLPFNRPGPRPGFTMLELIVALTLGMVLLSAVWTMFRLFLRHQEIETAQVERTQLVSSLHQLLSRDLLNVFPEGREGPPGPVTPAAKPSSTPAFDPSNPLLLLPGMPAELSLSRVTPEAEETGRSLFTLPTSSLRGDGRRLELVIFAGPDDTAVSAAEPRKPVGGSLERESEPARLPSKIVVYEFVGLTEEFALSASDSFARSDAEDSMADPLETALATVGLWRRESLESSPSPTAAGGEGSLSSAGNTSRPRSPEAIEASPPELAGSASTGFSSSLLAEEFAPEVIDLSFAYFDGRKWNSSWDSQRQRRLPVLVRVQLAIETRDLPRSRKLAERLQAGPERDAETESGPTALEETGFTPEPDRAGLRSRAAGDELRESPWDYEFLLYVTAAPSSSIALDSRGGPTPLAEPSGRPPTSSPVETGPRPRGGGLKQ